MVMGYIYITIIAVVVVVVWLLVFAGFYMHRKDVDKADRIMESMRTDAKAFEYLSPADKEWLKSHFDISNEK